MRIRSEERIMNKSAKVRISLDCSIEERKLIKTLASLEDMTISDYLIALAKTNLSIAKNKLDQFSSLNSLTKKEKTSKHEDGVTWDEVLENIG